MFLGQVPPIARQGFVEAFPPSLSNIVGHGVLPAGRQPAKKAIHQGLQGDLRSGLNFEVAAYMPLIHTQDRREGTLAFNEKRKPRFTGA